jgi:hypothetical protein
MDFYVLSLRYVVCFAWLETPMVPLQVQGDGARLLCYIVMLYIQGAVLRSALTWLRRLRNNNPALNLPVSGAHM